MCEARKQSCGFTLKGRKQRWGVFSTGGFFFLLFFFCVGQYAGATTHKNAGTDHRRALDGASAVTLSYAGAQKRVCVEKDGWRKGGGQI